MKKLILITVLLIAVCSVQLAYAQIPHLISYQGRLTDNSGMPITGNRNITFRIWDAKIGGSKLWEDTYSVTITEGIFEVLLGSGAESLNLDFDKPYYLEIKVGTEVMDERQELTSSGYAYRAEVAEDAAKVGGIEASATPEADKLVALDSSGKLPVSTLKTSDTGWFYVEGGKSYTRPHNLGTQKVIWQLYFATDGSGSNMEKVDFGRGGNGTPHGACVYGITTTSISVKTASYITTYDNLGGPSYSSGYYRLIGIALE